MKFGSVSMNKENIYFCFISDDNFINLPKYLKRHLLIDSIRIKKKTLDRLIAKETLDQSLAKNIKYNFELIDSYSIRVMRRKTKMKKLLGNPR
jgi:hypothetical protein